MAVISQYVCDSSHLIVCTSILLALYVNNISIEQDPTQTFKTYVKSKNLSIISKHNFVTQNEERGVSLETAPLFCNGEPTDFAVKFMCTFNESSFKVRKTLGCLELGTGRESIL